MTVTSTLNDLIVRLQTSIRDKDLGAAEAVGKEIEALNNVSALAARKVVYICNITDQPFSLTRTFGYVNVYRAQKGQRYGLTPVREYHDRIVYDDKHKIDVTFPAAEVAEDVVRSCNADAGDDEFPNSFLGVFLCQGDVPTEEELALAEDKLAEFYIHLVRKADEKWSATHNYKEITGAERRAAAHIGVKREWLFAPETNVLCPFCQQPMPKGAVIHAGPGGCGQVVDQKRYKEMTSPVLAPSVLPTDLSDDDLDALTKPNVTK